MADIKVTAEPTLTKGPDLKGKDKPYGESSYKSMSFTIKMHCVDTRHKNQDYEPDGKPEADDEHLNCWCRCYLSEVHLDIAFTVRYNPDKIKDGWINPDTKDAHDSSHKKAGDLQLTQESVEVHERAHCDFLAEKIRKKIEDALNKIKNTAFAECKCGEHQKCKDNLIKQVQAQIDAIGKDEWEKMLKELDESYRGSESEKDAREKQVKYLKEHPHP